jgi:DmsE family decaheme c-type cytochrome
MAGPSRLSEFFQAYNIGTRHMWIKFMKQRAAWLAMILGTALSSPLPAADKADAAKEQVSWVHMSLEAKEAGVAGINQAKFAKDGADTCVSCHDEENEYPVFPIFKTKHAVKADPRGPFSHGNKQCESCHGAGGNHTKAKKTEKRAGNIINFGRNAWTPVKDQNEKCLTCHQNHQRIAWKGSSHAFNDVACTACHTVHTARDPVLERQAQAKVCLTCHANEQARFQQASHHPVREGRMSCTDCHDVHGDNGSGLMVKASARDKCTSCHAEKRGPFLWDHAPAAEDCNLCHSPHGSNQPALLKKRVPQLCQECHSPAGHPSASYNGSKLAGMFLGAKGCANCHSAVHGSNHPAGVTQLR